LIKTVELRGHVGGTVLFGERSETADVDEQNRNDESLPARRSELVSKRAEVRVLSRRTDL